MNKLLQKLLEYSGQKHLSEMQNRIDTEDFHVKKGSLKSAEQIKKEASLKIQEGIKQHQKSVHEGYNIIVEELKKEFN